MDGSVPDGRGHFCRKQWSGKAGEREEHQAGSAQEKAIITGSLIPQKVKPDRIPATSSPVVIISRKDIERSGAATVTESLRRQGVGR